MSVNASSSPSTTTTISVQCTSKHVIVAVVTFLLTSGIAVLIIVYLYRRQHNQKCCGTFLTNWKINPEDLVPVVPLNEDEKPDGIPSLRSIRSQPSSIHFNFYHYKEEEVAGEKHDCNVAISRKIKNEIKALQRVEHEHLNRFYGISYHADLTLSVWKYCGRGSLKDMIRRRNFCIDDVFTMCLLRDMISGVLALHNVLKMSHGRIAPTRFLVSNQFQVKLSGFGLSRFREKSWLTEEELRYAAPELRVETLPVPNTKEADIYSTALVMAELMTRTQVSGSFGSISELTKFITSGEPSNENVISCNSEVLEALRKSFSYDPQERPDSTHFNDVIKRSLGNNKPDVMDHLINSLEMQAATLNAKVLLRTEELKEEMEKSDNLLYSMLPKSVANTLKAGCAVAPEEYDEVTIFFSDIVNFTNYASQCRPNQVVTLLNELYTVMDSWIKLFDVYKVETIGDAYMCVSGVPQRNGKNHVREIAMMAIQLRDATLNFPVPDSSKTVQLRCGIHSGSVMAGVVGLTMPRFCLFGDTVNTASRMESTGEGGQIHMSSCSYDLIQDHHSRQFDFSYRGEISVKGKGKMNTYWLLSGPKRHKHN